LPPVFGGVFFFGGVAAAVADELVLGAAELSAVAGTADAAGVAVAGVSVAADVAGAAAAAVGEPPQPFAEHDFWPAAPGVVEGATSVAPTAAGCDPPHPMLRTALVPRAASVVTRWSNDRFGRIVISSVLLRPAGAFGFAGRNRLQVTTASPWR
jgi:hypothetical protein